MLTLKKKKSSKKKLSSNLEEIGLGREEADLSLTGSVCRCGPWPELCVRGPVDGGGRSASSSSAGQQAGRQRTEAENEEVKEK